jgi:hypothetical protein
LIGYKTGLTYVFHREEKGSKNAKAIELIVKYKTFKKNGLCSIIKFKRTIQYIKKRKIAKPIIKNKLLN